MPFLAFSVDIFRKVNTQENVVVSSVFYPSLVLSLQCLTGKRGQ